MKIINPEPNTTQQNNETTEQPTQICPNCFIKLTDTKNYQKNKRKHWYCYRCKTEFKKPLQDFGKHLPRGRWRKEAIPSPDENLYKQLVLNITDTQIRALVAILYLTGSRIREILSKTHYKWQQGTRTEDFKENGIMAGQIKFVPDGSILFINLRVEKRRGKPILREVPTSMKDIELVNIIKDYVLFGKNNGPFDVKDELFNISYSEAYKFIKEYTGLHPHTLRHYCVSMRFVRDNFKEIHLKQFIGWSNTRPAETYTHLNTKELKKLLEEKYS